MPDEKMKQLCAKISAEKDPLKVMSLTEQLIKLLDEEQDAIRAKIRANIGKGSAEMK